MRRIVLTSIWFLGLVSVAATPLAAQSASNRDQAGVSFAYPPTPYATEIALHLGVWTLMEGGGEFGGHVTRNRNEWFALEGGLSYRPGAEDRRPSRLVSANIRMGVHHPHKLALAFFTLGVAAGNSANFSVSPMLGVGIQVGRIGYRGRESPVKLRVELQILPRGRSTDDRGRLLIGMAATFGRRR